MGLSLLYHGRCAWLRMPIVTAAALLTRPHRPLLHRLGHGRVSVEHSVPRPRRLREACTWRASRLSDNPLTLHAVPTAQRATEADSRRPSTPTGHGPPLRCSCTQLRRRALCLLCFAPSTRISRSTIQAPPAYHDTVTNVPWTVASPPPNFRGPMGPPPGAQPQVPPGGPYQQYPPYPPPAAAAPGMYAPPMPGTAFSGPVPPMPGTAFAGAAPPMTQPPFAPVGAPYAGAASASMPAHAGAAGSANVEPADIKKHRLQEDEAAIASFLANPADGAAISAFQPSAPPASDP